jgi:hypothetical protein
MKGGRISNSDQRTYIVIAHRIGGRGEDLSRPAADRAQENRGNSINGCDGICDRKDDTSLMQSQLMLLDSRLRRRAVVALTLHGSRPERFSS